MYVAVGDIKVSILGNIELAYVEAIKEHKIV